jgi:hypothetical protein
VTKNGHACAEVAHDPPDENSPGDEEHRRPPKELGRRLTDRAELADLELARHH